MNKAILLCMLLPLAVVSCNKPKGYSRSPHGFYYKLHQLGQSGRQGEAGDYAMARIAYHTMGDSLLYSRKVHLHLRPGTAGGSIDRMLMMLHEGDSASYILEADQYFMSSVNQPAPGHLQGKQIKVGLRLEKVQSGAEHEREKEAFMAWAGDLAEYEQKVLQDYLENRFPGHPVMQEGYYKITMKEGRGDVVAKGDTVQLHYKGRFLNGRFVDSSYPLKEAFSLVYGQEGQLLEGLGRAVGNMCEGEVALVLLPSDLAYGAEGSSTGIVPPFTPMIYEVEILDIKRSR